MAPPTTVEELIANLTTEEKVSLLSGADGRHTQNIPRLGIGFLKVKSQPTWSTQKHASPFKLPLTKE
jgi:hypothetical protein